MAATASTMMDLGTPAPDFSLPDTDDEVVSRGDFANEPLVVMFICNHCPYVRHTAPQIAQIAREYQPRGVGFVAIQSNDVQSHPDDRPERMAREKTEQGYTFPYLYDASQETAKIFSAACTPDVFVFDGDHKLYYRGQVDDTRPHRISSGNYDSSKSPATGEDLRGALNTLLEGKPPPHDQKPSMGCNIKWKPGNAPAYAGGG